MKIKASEKAETLTTGGGFSLEKGAGTLAVHGVGRSLSNRRATSQSISAWVKAMSNKEFIRPE
jgi:hypothetical protein